jgi:hypothetical protein
MPHFATVRPCGWEGRSNRKKSGDLPQSLIDESFREKRLCIKSEKGKLHKWLHSFQKSALS